MKTKIIQLDGLCAKPDLVFIDYKMFRQLMLHKELKLTRKKQSSKRVVDILVSADFQSNLPCKFFFIKVCNKK